MLCHDVTTSSRHLKLWEFLPLGKSRSLPLKKIPTAKVFLEALTASNCLQARLFITICPDMARPVIHVSDVEAASNFGGLLAQVRAGADVVIEHNAQAIAVLRPVLATLDWSECPQVETDPLRVSGRPVIKDTRMPADDILANYEYGVSVEEIAEQFGIEAETIRDVLNYAERHNALARPLG